VKRYANTIVASCVVPWDEGYHFNERLFRKQVRFLRESLTRHLYIFGTAGEGHAVTETQFDTIARVFREEADHADSTAMLGVISLSLPAMLERIERGWRMGYRFFQISLPSWGALTDREVDAFFRETCGRFTDCQFLHYNLMRAKKLLTGDDYARLAAAHPNLAAVKSGSMDKEFLVGLLTKAPQIQYFIGELAYGMLRDTYECSLLISLAATNAKTAWDFFNSRGEKLARYTEELRKGRELLLGSVTNGAHMDGAYDKLLYRVHDREFPLRLLPPYSSADEQMCENFVNGLLPHWRPQL
jgi:hypothetical protein